MDKFGQISTELWPLIDVINWVFTNFGISLPIFFKLCMRRSSYVFPLLGRETYCFSPGACLSVRLSVCHKSCSLYNLKTPQALFTKLCCIPGPLLCYYFIQISISMRWRAEWKNGNSAFYTFWVISLWTLCIAKIVSALSLENRLSFIHETINKYQSAGRTCRVQEW